MDKVLTTYAVPFYKYNIISDIDLGRLTNNDSPYIMLRSHPGNKIQQEQIYEECYGLFKIASPTASYTIDFRGNRIEVFYDDIENINSTLYNLPASVWASYNNDLLLHASGICVNDKIVAFCAKKGIGKSTLISFLGKEYPVFSDDTLYLSENQMDVLCYSYSNILKLTEQTCLIHTMDQNNNELFDSARKTLQNKAYIDVTRLKLNTFHQENNYPPLLSTICFLHRGNCDDFSIRIINNRIEKASLLLENCVGTEYFSARMIKHMLESSIYRTILNQFDFIHVCIPDSLIYLKNNYKQFLLQLRGKI